MRWVGCPSAARQTTSDVGTRLGGARVPMAGASRTTNRPRGAIRQRHATRVDYALGRCAATAWQRPATSIRPDSQREIHTTADLRSITVKSFSPTFPSCSEALLVPQASSCPLSAGKAMGGEPPLSGCRGGRRGSTRSSFGPYPRECLQPERTTAPAVLDRLATNR